MARERVVQHPREAAATTHRGSSQSDSRISDVLGSPFNPDDREFDEALRPTACHLRLWGTDPWTQGYVTQWTPGEVMAVGPLHGRHEPPFYVCGSDQWVAGYMEGAVRTGRAD